MQKLSSLAGRAFRTPAGARECALSIMGLNAIIKLEGAATTASIRSNVSTPSLLSVAQVIAQGLAASDVRDWEPFRFSTAAALVVQFATLSRGLSPKRAAEKRAPFRSMLLAMLDSLVARVQARDPWTHELGMPVLSHLLHGAQEFGVAPDHPGIGAILRLIVERAEATLAAASAAAAAAASPVASSSRAIPLSRVVARGAPADAESLASESDHDIQRRFFASETEEAAPGFDPDAHPAVQQQRKIFQLPPEAPPPLPFAGVAGMGDASGTAGLNASTPRAPRWQNLDISSVSFTLEALTRMGRLSEPHEARGQEHPTPHTLRTTSAGDSASAVAELAREEVRTVWRPVAAALATLDFHQASARDISVILSALAKADSTTPALLTRLADRVCALDAGAISHPRAYANLVLGFTDAGVARADLWQHLYKCLHYEFSLRRMDASSSSAGRTHFRLPQLLCILTRWPTATSAQGAQLMRLASPMLLSELREKEAAAARVDAGGILGAWWYEASAELVHAYAVLCNAAARLHASMPELFTAADTAVSGTLTRYHAAMAAYPSSAPAREPFHATMITLIVGAFHHNHQHPRRLFDVAALHLERLLLHGHPTDTRIVPVYLAGTLTAFAQAHRAPSGPTLEQRRLFVASSLYLRWLLRSSKLSDSMAPSFYVACAEAFVLAGVSDRALLTDLADYLVGPDEGRVACSSPESEQRRDRFGRKPEKWGHQRVDGASGDSLSAKPPNALANSAQTSSSLYQAALLQPVIQRGQGLNGFATKLLQQLRNAYISAAVRHERLFGAIAAAEEAGVHAAAAG